jgi:hypothetical protein
MEPFRASDAALRTAPLLRQSLERRSSFWLRRDGFPAFSFHDPGADDSDVSFPLSPDHLGTPELTQLIGRVRRLYA